MALEPTFGGATLAVVAVAAGAPLFNDGYRALRLRRAFARLQERPLTDLPTGIVHVRGRVGLDSPLFSPLSGKPCAGFRIEAASRDFGVRGVVEERRPFRLVAGEVAAMVLAGRGSWELAPTATREWSAGEALSENVTALLERIPEWDWMRRHAPRVTLVERALVAGSEVHVVAYGRHAEPFEMIVEAELLATGTDGAVSYTGPAARRAAAHRPDLWLGPGEQLDFLLVSDEVPTGLERRLPAWRLMNLFTGPLVSLSGLAYLAYAVDRLRTLGHE
jgi:hypothetical protein